MKSESTWGQDKPEISAELISYLREVIPNRQINPQMTKEEIMYEAGKQYIIELLDKIRMAKN